MGEFRRERWEGEGMVECRWEWMTDHLALTKSEHRNCLRLRGKDIVFFGYNFW